MHIIYKKFLKGNGLPNGNWNLRKRTWNEKPAEAESKAKVEEYLQGNKATGKNLLKAAKFSDPGWNFLLYGSNPITWLQSK